MYNQEEYMEKDFDLFLFVPCDLTFFNENKIAKNITQEGGFLVSEIEKDNNNDLKNNYIKTLKRLEIGKYHFKFNNQTVLEEDGIIYLTIHPRSGLGIFSVYLSRIKNKPNEILDAFISSRFSIDDIPVNEWTSKFNISLLGTSRCLAFSFSKLTEREKMSILACDAAESKLKGKEFIEAANLDIAQYNGADVFCSENVLLEVQHDPITDVKQRIEIEAWEIFFMELLLLQDGAISRACNKIIYEFDREGNNPLNATNTDILDSLSSELSESILFLDFNNFIYPTTRISAEKIAHHFRIDKLIDKYNTYKGLLESLITIRKNNVEDLETDNMNVLLLILTLTQVLPVLASLFDMIINKELSLNSIISFISSIGVCFILLIVFKYINKRKKKKYSEDLLNFRRNKL